MKLFNQLTTLGIFCLLLTHTASAQLSDIIDQRCATMEMDARLRQNFPDRGSLNDFENHIAPHVEQFKRQQNEGYRAPLLTIPVVFHIITDGAGAENISAAQVQAQVDQLNIDFRDLAGSTNATRADLEIEFCLATLDPSDNIMAEQGINRVTTYGDGPFTTNQIDGTIKPGTIWSPDDYMNIWVCDISGGILGYAQFPDASGLGGLNNNGGAANTDGVVHLYSTIGSVANPFPGGAPYNLGRTMTHEVGHWMGLRHIWGDGNCGVDDFCNDTPNSDNSNFGCPNGHVSCNSVDQIENYMDYTNDACMDLFTADQKARVRTVMSISPRRAALANSSKCGVAVPTIAFVSGGGTIINEQTNCSFQDIVLDLSISTAPSADATVTFSQSGTATIGTDFDILTGSVLFAAGSTNNQQLTVRIYNDGVVEANETLLISFNVATNGDAVATVGDLLDHDISINDDDVAPAAGGSVLLFSEDFEGGNLGNFTTQGFGGSDRFVNGNRATLTSANWTVDANNPSNFAYTNDDRCNCNKNNDRLTSAVFSLAGTFSTATLSFDHAYADINGNVSGVFVNETGEVQISIGGAWTTIANLTNNSIAAANDFYNTPWQIGQTVDLSPYIGQTNVRIRFRYRDGGQWAYGMAVDNILITGGSTTNIQITDNTATPESIQIGSLETVHYYDLNSGDVMGTIQNQSTWDYQCTRVEVDRDAVAANGPTAPFWDNNPANALAAKTFFVQPNNNSATGNYTITLYYTEDEIAAWELATGKSRNALKIIKVSNTPVDLIDDNNYTSYTIEQVPAILSNFGGDVGLTASFSTGFSGFAVGDPGNPPNTLLPLELLSFEATKQRASVQLDWQTQSEQNIDYFILERSVDGINYSNLQQVAAVGQSNKSEVNHYAYQDYNPIVGYNYYRLKQVDLNGEVVNSKVIAVSFEQASTSVIQLQPNPAIEDLFINIQAKDETPISMTVFNTTGQQVLQRKDGSVFIGTNRLKLPIKSLSEGVYILQIQQGAFSKSFRFVKKYNY